MNSEVQLISRSNPAFSAYTFYAGFLLLKMLAMSSLTARQRFKKGVCANIEDTLFVDTVRYDDPDIERVRRAHRNDVENILLFLVISPLYLLTNPSQLIAMNLFHVFTLARLLHTFVYTIMIIPQPARLVTFGVGYIVTGYMALQVIISFM